MCVDAVTIIFRIQIGQHNRAAGGAVTTGQREVENNSLVFCDFVESAYAVLGGFVTVAGHRTEADNIAVAIVIDADVVVCGAESGLDVVGHSASGILESDFNDGLITG